VTGVDVFFLTSPSLLNRKSLLKVPQITMKGSSFHKYLHSMTPVLEIMWGFLSELILLIVRFIV